MLLLASCLSLTALLAACALAEEGAAPGDGDANETAVVEEAAEETPEAAEEATTEDAEEADETASTRPALSGDYPLAALDPAERNDYFDAPPEMALEADTYYYATIETEKGNIRAQLFADRAPATVNNFVFLANQGFYDGTVFHRVLDGFMAQAGDPTGTGSGGPGYAFEDEFVSGLGFDRPGLLAMANSGPATNGSQFFITYAPTDWLNNRHTIFGEVLEGSDVLSQLTLRDPSQSPGFDGDLIKTIRIETAQASELPTPTPMPPTPTPYPPSALDAADRPLAAVAPAERSNYFSAPPEMVIDVEAGYVATIATTAGDMVFELAADLAPVAVNNFVLLADLGFYDGLPINQISPDQVVIIGSPDSNPLNDAGYKFDAELGLDVELAKGVMAYIPFQNTPGEPIAASSSQLLIALIAPPPESNDSFSFFGTLIEGEDVLDALTMEDIIESITVEVSE